MKKIEKLVYDKVWASKKLESEIQLLAITNRYIADTEHSICVSNKLIDKLKWYNYFKRKNALMCLTKKQDDLKFDLKIKQKLSRNIKNNKNLIALLEKQITSTTNLMKMGNCINNIESNRKETKEEKK